jgi:DNA-binding IclR family transcriptional regulator
MHLDRLLHILETVAIAGRPLSAADIQQATGLPRPTCYRLLQTLRDSGLLDDDQSGSGRYQPGQRLLRLAMIGKSDADVRQAALPSLRRAADDFGEATFLSRFRNQGVEIIHVETPSDPNRAYMHPGLGFRPMHACSCSKAIAAFAEPDFQQSILDGPMKAYTDHTKTTPELLADEFAAIRQHGFAECVEEIEAGVSSVAAPVHNGSVGATLSIGTIGPVRRFTAAYRSTLGARLLGHAEQVAVAMDLH